MLAGDLPLASNLTHPVPIFSWVKTYGRFLDLLIPFETFSRRPRSAAENVPWEEKKPKAIWRGSSTGGGYAKVRARQLLR